MLKAFIMLTIAVALIATGCGGGGGGGGSPIPTPSAETGSISGQIVNSTIAIGGGSVRAQGAGSEEIKVYVEQNPSLTTLADATGKFLLENVPAGVVNLIAEHKTPDGQLFRMKSDEITVEAAKIYEIPATIEVKAAKHVLAGRIVNSKTSEVVSGVTISVWGKETTSGVDGSFTIENLVDIAIAYQVKFAKSGFEAQTKSIKISDTNASLLEVQLVPLPNTGAVKGTLAENGPLQGVDIFCEQYPDIKTSTDAAGKFLLENIPAGKIRIIALTPFGESVMRGSAECTITIGTTFDLTTPVTMIVNSKNAHGIIDVTGGTASENAAAIIGVKVTALGQTVLSNDFGYFKFENLPPEKITLAFEKPGLASRTVEVDLTTVGTVDLTPFAMTRLKPEEIPEQDIPLRSLDNIVKGMSKSAITADESLIRLTVEAIVRLPENAGVTRRSLHSLTTESIDQVEADGYVTTNSIVGSATPALVIVGFKQFAGSEEVQPLLLKIWHPKDPNFVPEDQYIDTNSTAEALVLLDNVFWSLSSDKFLEAREKVRNNTNLPALARSVEYALQNPDTETLFRDAIIRGSQSIAKAVASAMNLSLSARPSLRSATGDVDKGKAVYVEDDGARSSSAVMLTNRSYCHYTVEIKNGMTNLVVKSPAGNNYFTMERSTHTSYSWSWPPDRKIQVEANIGPGEFITTFNKQKGLSVFDGLMTLAGTVIGAGASSYEELSEGYSLIANTSTGLIEIITKATTASINSSADALKLADELLFSTGKMGFDVLMDFAPKYFGKKLEREFKNSWFKTTAKFFMKKALIWGVAAYNTTDVALIIYDVAKTPDSYTEKGWQTKAGWYGDLFAEKIGKMKNMRVIFGLPMNGTAYYKEIANDGTETETSVETSNSEVQHLMGPVVPIDGTLVSINADPTERKLIGASYEHSNSRGTVGVEFSNVGFNGFIDRYNNNAFDETKMQFVWGNPGADMVQITKISSKDVYPATIAFDYFDHWEYSSTEWASVKPNYGYVAGVILSE
jgi:hypothetical protein